MNQLPLTKLFQENILLTGKKAAKSEFDSLLENHTWDLVTPLEDKNIVGSRWVFKA